MGPLRWYRYHAPFGGLSILSEGEEILRLAFGSPAFEGTFAPSAAMNAAATQALQFLSGRRTALTFPFRLVGTAFQREVWEALTLIPYGQTRTLGELAASLGRPNAARAVAEAARANPIELAVPSHRLLTASSLLEREGPRFELHRALLALEGSLPSG